MRTRVFIQRKFLDCTSIGLSLTIETADNLKKQNTKNYTQNTEIKHLNN